MMTICPYIGLNSQKSALKYLVKNHMDLTYTHNSKLNTIFTTHTLEFDFKLLIYIEQYQ